MQASLWEKESFYRPSDIIIIGSGFVGLWTALELKQRKPSLDITVIDRGTIPTGASTRNAGFSCFGSPTELIADEKQWGQEKMLAMVSMRYKGLAIIQQTFKAKEIDYKEYGGYEMLDDNTSYKLPDLHSDLKKLNKALRPVIGNKKVFTINDRKIKKFGFQGIRHMVENPYEGQLHAGKLTQALVEKLQKLGVRMLFGFEAAAFEKANGGVVVRNKQGIELRSEQLLIATNAFTSELLPQLNIQPARGQVLVTSEIPGLKLKGCFHYDEGYVYFRNYGKRLLLGGARNKFFEEERTPDLTTTSPNIQQELERLMRKVILPGEKGYTIEHRWSGIMGMGSEKQPTIGELQTGVLYAVGLGGIGLATSPVVAKMLAKRML